MSDYLRITIKYNEKLTTPRAHRQLLNALYREMLQHHKEVVLPRHFENVPETAPGGAYGYARRSQKWLSRKEREGRGDQPLVYRGLMRTIVLRETQVRATYKGGSITAKNHYAMRPQRRHEVEVISRREKRRMAGRMRIDYVKRVKQPPYARMRQKRIMGS